MVTATASIVWILLVSSPTASAQAKPCLTKLEARQIYRTDHLYWHTSAHCWDDQASGSDLGDNEPKVVTAAARPATSAAAVRPHIEIAFPSLVKSDGVPPAQWPARLQVDWFSPWSLLTHPWIWDFDARDTFTPWHKRVE
jgi:hypothetical protein